MGYKPELSRYYDEPNEDYPTFGQPHGADASDRGSPGWEGRHDDSPPLLPSDEHGD
ncbi:MAG: hypothetical protein METHAR1v1_1540002, partial [Methanothrix sp.]